MSENSPHPKGINSRTPPPARPASTWQFVNSPFVIFLFSSVCVGLLSFSYRQWRDHQSNDKKIEQLDLEIALRIQAMDQMASGPDNTRFSNLVNISRAMNGDPTSSFYVRKPMFGEFDNKNIASLLWQLYLLVPANRQERIKTVIRESNVISDEIRKVRFRAASDLDDERPKPKTKKEQRQRDDEDDQLKKDYGQLDVYERIHSLSQIEPWKALVR